MAARIWRLRSPWWGVRARVSAVRMVRPRAQRGAAPVLRQQARQCNFESDCLLACQHRRVGCSFRLVCSAVASARTAAVAAAAAFVHTHSSKCPFVHTLSNQCAQISQKIPSAYISKSLNVVQQLLNCVCMRIDSEYLADESPGFVGTYAFWPCSSNAGQHVPCHLNLNRSSRSTGWRSWQFNQHSPRTMHSAMLCHLGPDLASGAGADLRTGLE
jgi:hypothetical protein